VSELYANLMQKRAKQGSRDAFIIENLYISKVRRPLLPYTFIKCRHVFSLKSVQHM
jgi:hypothetical protein